MRQAPIRNSIPLRKRALQGQGVLQAPQVLLFGDLTRPQPGEVRVLDLAVEKLVTALLQPVHQVDQADFGGLPHAGEHRLAHERAAKSDAVETACELAASIRLDAVGFARVMQPDISVYDLRGDPILLPGGARPYDDIEFLI